MLLKSQFRKWSPLHKSLHTLLSGALVTERVRFVSGKVTTAECPFCHHADENAFHLLWKCSAWQHIRSELLHLQLTPEEWPPAMQLCGFFVPDAPTPLTLVIGPRSKLFWQKLSRTAHNFSLTMTCLMRPLSGPLIVITSILLLFRCMRKRDLRIIPCFVFFRHRALTLPFLSCPFSHVAPCLTQVLPALGIGDALHGPLSNNTGVR